MTMNTLTEDQTAALVALHFRPDPGSTAADVVASLIGGSIAAQIEEPSDSDAEAAEAIGALDLWNDLAARLREVNESAIREWLADQDDTPACQWCNGTGCKSCGFTGRGDTHDEGCTGLPCTCEG